MNGENSQYESTSQPLIDNATTQSTVLMKPRKVTAKAFDNEHVVWWTWLKYTAVMENDVGEHRFFYIRGELVDNDVNLKNYKLPDLSCK